MTHRAIAIKAGIGARWTTRRMHRTIAYQRRAVGLSTTRQPMSPPTGISTSSRCGGQNPLPYRTLNPSPHLFIKNTLPFPLPQP